MVDIAVDSFSGSDANGGVGWDDEFQRLTAAYAIAGPDDTIWLRNSNGGGFNELLGADATFAGPQSIGSKPIKIIAVNSTTTNWPPLASDIVDNQSHSDTAIIESTGNFDIRSTGLNYWFSVIVKSGAHFNDSRSECASIFENCQIHVGLNAGGNRYLYIGATSSPSGPWTLTLINSDFIGSQPGDAIAFHRSGKLIWRGGAIPTIALNDVFIFQEGGICDVTGVDLSTQTGNIVSLPSTAEMAVHATILRCLLNPLATKILNNSPMQIGDIAFIECDYIDNKNNANYNRQEGDVITDTGIYKTDGYPAFGVNYSLKFSTNANAVEIIKPLRIKIAEFPIDLTVSQDYKIPFVHDSLASLNNTQLWIEAVTPGQSSTLGQFISTRVANIKSIPITYPVSSETWNGTIGMVNENKQEATVTLPAGKHAMVEFYLCLAIINKDVYVSNPVLV